MEQPTAPQGNPLEGGSLTPHPLGTLSEVSRFNIYGVLTSFSILCVFGSPAARTDFAGMVFCKSRPSEDLPSNMHRSLDTQGRSEWYPPFNARPPSAAHIKLARRAFMPGRRPDSLAVVLGFCGSCYQLRRRLKLPRHVGCATSCHPRLWDQGGGSCDITITRRYDRE